MRGTIRSRGAFRNVYENGRKAVGRHMVVFALVPVANDAGVDGAESVDPTRVGVVASRKVGNAVARSRAKRVLRAAFSPLRAGLPDGTQIVLVARRSLIENGLRSTQAEREMRDLIEHLLRSQDPTGRSRSDPGKDAAARGRGGKASR